MGEMAGRSCVDNREVKEEFKEFYQHLIQNSQVGDLRMFVAGSRSEIPGQEQMLHQHRLSQDLLDADRMLCSTYIYVITCRENVPDQFNGRVVRIYLDGQHAGYVKLFDEYAETEFKRTDLAPAIQGAMLHGPAETLNIANTRKQDEILKRFISEDNWMANQYNMIPIEDRVMAVHSRYWPLEMNKWLTRQRLSDLPSKSIIKQVVQYGCDFVQVSHNRCNTDTNEWRFSFSKAELIIINSWTISQRCVYRTLHVLNKMIKSSMEDSKLRTYYFKTLMLWATEEKPAEFCFEHVLVNSVYELLCELMHWLHQKFCPNYFIPTNNMIDHLTDTELREDIDALYQLSQNRVSIVDVLSTSKAVETVYRNQNYWIKVPVWLYTSLLIFEQLKLSEDISSKQFTKISSGLVEQAISIELLDIYHGLYYSLMAGNSLIQSDSYYIMKSIEHFHGYRFSDTAQASVVEFCSRNVALNVIPVWFMHYELDSSESHLLLATPNAFTYADSWNVLNVDNKQTDEKCMLYSQSMDNVDKTITTDVHFNENIYGNNWTFLTMYWTLTVGNKTCTGAQFYKEWSRVSPTVNISWFINNAYLANLYYITIQDYRAAKEICDNIIHICKQSFHNEQFAEDSLPLTISTDWTLVYDEELQALLGLFSLCSFIFNKTDHSRSVYLSVCPVQFALYLRCRCASDQKDIEMWYKCARETNVHFEKCRHVSRAHNDGRAVQRSFLRLILRKLEQLVTFS